MTNKIALYTVLTGSYDRLTQLNAQYVSGIDCYVVTDDPDLSESGWKPILVNREADPHRQQRRLKLDFTLIPQLDSYEKIVYVDANISLLRPINEILRVYRGGLLTVQHPLRNCVYHEAWAIIDLKKAGREETLNQIADYAKAGIRPASGMYQTGVMIRDRSEKVIEFCKEWLSELEKYTHRDQLSIIPARDRTGIQIATVNINVFRRMFKINPHITKKKPKIHYLLPYSTEKNIGKAYNEAIEQLKAADDDWIVLRDGDTLFPTPQWGNQINEALMRCGHDFGLIGAMTNRIGDTHQRVEGMFDEWDIRKHVTKAFELQDQYWAEVEETAKGVAGFFMAFQVKTWKQIKFVDTTDPNISRMFDTAFYKAVRAKKMKVGLMKGLYILHLYRPLSDNPRQDVKHLL